MNNKYNVMSLLKPQIWAICGFMAQGHEKFKLAIRYIHVDKSVLRNHALMSKLLLEHFIYMVASLLLSISSITTSKLTIMNRHTKKCIYIAPTKWSIPRWKYKTNWRSLDTMPTLYALVWHQCDADAHIITSEISFNTKES